MVHVTAVTISRRKLLLGPSVKIPHYCHTDGFREVDRTRPTRVRIEYLAERRNRAHEAALELYPETEVFFDVDSYYVSQGSSLNHLIQEYESFGTPIILGASTWWDDQRYFPSKRLYWDTWTTPEGIGKPFGFAPKLPNLPAGMMTVAAVGGVVLYPRSAFDRAGFGVPEPFPEAGNEIHYFCKRAGLECILSFNVRMFHPNMFPAFSFPRRLAHDFLMSSTWQQMKQALVIAPAEAQIAGSLLKRLTKKLRLSKVRSGL